MKKINLLVLLVLIFIGVRSNAQEGSDFIVKTNSIDCEVFVDGAKVGAGELVKVPVDPKKILRQIKVTRPGYLPEYEVFYFKEKEIVVKNLESGFNESLILSPEIFTFLIVFQNSRMYCFV